MVAARLSEALADQVAADGYEVERGRLGRANGSTDPLPRRR
jgi:hypothetical protein